MKSQEVVKSIVARYRPEYRYLLDAEVVNGRKVHGKFLVKDSAHLIGKKLHHLAITETQLCLNQLLQVYVAYLIRRGYVKEWGPMEWKDYWGKKSSEHLFIVENHIDFNEKIYPGQEFYGTLILQEEFKSKRGNYHLKFYFNFNDGAHSGYVRIAFVP